MALAPARVLAATVGGLALVTLITSLASPSPTRLVAPPAPAEPVASTTLVCPPSQGVPSAVVTYLTVWSPPGLPGQERPGRATVRPVSGKAGASPNRTLTKAGKATSVVTSTRRTPAVTVRGVGGLAPGLTADLLTVSSRPTDRGLSSVGCTEPSADAWFVGGSSAVGRRSTLYLANADISPATLDVDVYGERGLINAPAGRGVVVPAQGDRKIAIDALAPGAGRVAVRVRVASGRVSSALRDEERRGLQPRGVDYVPPAAAPARSLVIPGLPAGTGRRELTVLVPGANDAMVQVEVMGKNGSFAPRGADVVEVSAGAIKAVDLTSAIDGEAVSLRLTSNVPITAGAFFRLSQRAKDPDFAWTSATPALVGAGGVASSVVGDGWSASVMIAAPEAEAVVEVRSGVPGGVTTIKKVRIPQGAVRLVSLGRSDESARRAVLVLPQEGSGPVHVARIQQYERTSGIRSTVLPIWSSRVLVNVPQAAPDLSAGVRGGAPS